MQKQEPKRHAGELLKYMDEISNELSKMAVGKSEKYQAKTAKVFGYAAAILSGESVERPRGISRLPMHVELAEHAEEFVQEMKSLKRAVSNTLVDRKDYVITKLDLDRAVLMSLRRK